MSDILSKPVNPLIPTRRPASGPSIEGAQQQRSGASGELPPMPPPAEANTAPQSPSGRRSVTLPLPGAENASEAPQIDSQTPPPLEPVVRPGSPASAPTLERVTRPAPPPLEPITPPAAEAAPAGPPPLQRIDRNAPAAVPATQAEVPVAVTPPPLEVVRRGAGAPPVEIPPLQTVARDIHGYVVIGVCDVEDTYDLYGIYLPEQIKALPGTNNKEKFTQLMARLVENFADPQLKARYDGGCISVRHVYPENTDNRLLMASEVCDSGNVLAEGDTAVEPYVRYTLKVIKYKMNSLDGVVRLNMIAS